MAPAPAKKEQSPPKSHPETKRKAPSGRRGKTSAGWESDPTKSNQWSKVRSGESRDSPEAEAAALTLCPGDPPASKGRE